MQAFLSTDFVSQANHAAHVATISAQAKRIVAKRNQSKQSAPVVSKQATKQSPAKPTADERAKQQAAQADDRRLARQCAANAVAEFYNGASKPFKAASDRFADINPSNAKAATARQAGLMLALITYGSGNMRRDGTFTRGGFIVPAKLVNPNAKPGETIRAQPESGCLGNMLARACDYVSGPRSGKLQSEAIYRLRPQAALAEIQAAFGDKPANAARKLLASFAA